LQDSETAIANLMSVSALLERENPDIVSLQEADSPSFWSGGFDHVTFLADRGSFGRSVRGIHVDALGLSYGTALIAKLDLRNPEAITFPPKVAAVPKGFVVSTMRWPGSNDHDVDVVSVHLDFISKSARNKQATELVDTLKRRNRPLIVMGDFNTDWQDEDSALRYIARALLLSSCDPESTTLDTFPAFGERLDWILVSPGIRFTSYRVIPDVVSDHRGVIAELILEPANAISNQGGNNPVRIHPPFELPCESRKSEPLDISGVIPSAHVVRRPQPCL
jgi:endonuclease/exonuclease/phosphatase family metal-dependent hydrolase